MQNSQSYCIEIALITCSVAKAISARYKYYLYTREDKIIKKISREMRRLMLIYDYISLARILSNSSALKLNLKTPPCATDIRPVSSETVTASASLACEIPRAAR